MAAFLGKGRKEDLIELAIELGVKVSSALTRTDNRKLIAENEHFIEDEAKVSLGRIIEDRFRRKTKQAEEQIREAERADRIRREERAHEIELKCLELKGDNVHLSEVVENLNETRSKDQLM